MAKEYYVKVGDEVTGPFSMGELQERRLAGKMGPQTLVRDGTLWIEAPEFFRQISAADPDKALRAAQLLEGQPYAAVDRARWESLLFIVSFPVLIPSLIVSYFTAKRWGHIDIYLIVIDGLLLTFICLVNSVWLGGVVLVSWLASIFLYWLRRDRQRYGIFLGYSNAVAMLLIAGGSGVIGGVIVMTPWKEIALWRTITSAPGSVNPVAAVNAALPTGRTVVLERASLDWSNEVYRQKVAGQWQFVSRQDLEGLRFSAKDLRNLWAIYPKLVGREVELIDVMRTDFGGVRTTVDIQEGSSRKSLDTGSRHFYLLAGSDLRIWIATAQEPPFGGALNIHGVFRPIYNDADLAKAYFKSSKASLPMMGLAVFEGEKGVPEPKPEAREVWVPVKDLRGAFWIRFPSGVEPRRDEAARGIVEGGLHEYEGLGDMSAKLFSKNDGRVLYQQSPAGYLAEQQVLARLRGRIDWKSGFWALLGLGVLGIAIWRAREEY